MDRRSIAQLRTATDLVTSRLAVDLSLGRPAGGDGNGPCDARLTDDLKARRQILGWSVDEVSGRCGIDRDALHGWERGIASPRLDALQRWATALGLSFRLVAAESEAQRGLKVDWETRRIAVDGTPVRLTPMEWRALERLARVPGELVTHQALFRHLYGDERHYRAQSTAIRVLITKLRRLLPLRIEAKWGKGYVVSGLDISVPGAPGNDDRADDDPAIVQSISAVAPCKRAAFSPQRVQHEPAPVPSRRDDIEVAEAGMRRIGAPPAARGPCRAEELGVIERFLAERGATRCPDVATIQQSPLPTLVWDKTKRKWVRPTGAVAAAAR